MALPSVWWFRYLVFLFHWLGGWIRFIVVSLAKSVCCLGCFACPARCVGCLRCKMSGGPFAANMCLQHGSTLALLC